MTHEQKLEAVRAKIIEAVPSIPKLEIACELSREKNKDKGSFHHLLIKRPIRLVDVLIAITNSKYLLRDQYKYPLWDAETPTVGDIILYEWIFEQDDLNLQSPETVSFLFDLLCK